jgi:hypothetical protein
MKTKIYTGISILTLLFSTTLNAQVEKDTTRLNLGETEVLIINTKKGKMIVDGEKLDTINAAPDKEDDYYDDDSHEGHWAGLDFGVTTLMNSNFKPSFPGNSFLENDPAKSYYWNINMVDHKFNIYKHYVGITTGFGVNFTQIGIKNNQILMDSPDSLYLFQDTVNRYSKNKLRGTYLQIPLMLEFNTKANEEKSFYLATGLIGGVRVGSALIQKIDNDNSDNKLKTKGAYGLNPFKLDASVRMGYGDWGIFANYALLPLFEKDKMVDAYPLTFGMSLNF